MASALEQTHTVAMCMHVRIVAGTLAVCILATRMRIHRCLACSPTISHGKLLRRCATIAADLTSPGECARVVATSAERLGGLTTLVNCAGNLPQNTKTRV